MYDELRTRNHLVYSCSVSVEPFRMSALPIFFTSASADKAKKVISRMRKILSEPERYLDEENFNRFKNMFVMSMKQQGIMRFAAPGNLTRYGMISDMQEIPNITYKYMMRVVRKYFGKGKFRIFAV